MKNRPVRDNGNARPGTKKLTVKGSSSRFKLHNMNRQKNVQFHKSISRVGIEKIISAQMTVRKVYNCERLFL